jgi:nucleoside-diphosphate-sugar epimerase
MDFVMSKFIDLALKNEDITIYGDGSQTRTFCYIEDNLDATLSILNGGHFINDVVNIGSDDEMTILELAQRIINKTQSKSRIVHLPPLAEGDMTRRRPDISKMKMVMKRPLTTMDKGIEELIKSKGSCVA